jgi:hypothetical protein
LAPADRIARRMAFPLWLPRLSMITRSLGFPVPCGTLATSLAARGAHPLGGAMFVLVHVSSMKIRLDSAPKFHPLCSPSCEVGAIALTGDDGFFEAQLLGVNELPHRSIITLRPSSAADRRECLPCDDRCRSRNHIAVSAPSRAFLRCFVEVDEPMGSYIQRIYRSTQRERRVRMKNEMTFPTVGTPMPPAWQSLPRVWHCKTLGSGLNKLITQWMPFNIWRQPGSKPSYQTCS